MKELILLVSLVCIFWIIAPEDFSVVEMFLGSPAITESTTTEFEAVAEIEALKFHKIFYEENYKVDISFVVDGNEFEKEMTISIVEYERLLSKQEIKIQGELTETKYEEKETDYSARKIRLLYLEEER